MSQRRRTQRNALHCTDEDDSETSDSEPENPIANHSRRTKMPSSSTVNSKFRASQNSQASTSRASQNTRTARRDTSADQYEFSQKSQSTGKLSEEEEKNLIATVVQYLLIADRPKTFIQRANIIKAALPNHSKHYKHIMPKVKQTLSEVFGYNLVELEGNKYILTNNLENSESHIVYEKSEKAEQVLLLIALTHIFMLDEDECRQEDLFDLLRNLSIIEDDDFKNDYFGDVKYLLTDKFIKQGYLDLVTIEKSDNPVKHYQWGARAEHELTPRHVLEFMSKIYGGRPLNSWPHQFKIMQMREDTDRSN